MPSTRSMARDLKTSRGVVTEAYEQLIAEGYLVTRPGSRTYVATLAPPVTAQLPVRQAVTFRFDFRPGVPDLSLFPTEAWVRCTRRSVQELRSDQLGYGDPCGTMELRTALQEYLARVRGVSASARDIVVCTGLAQGLAITARVLQKQGVRRIALEDPCNTAIRAIFSYAGLPICNVPVDEHGLRVDLLEKTRVRAVLVTPAHQFPTGSVLAATRRLQLHAWAARSGAYVVEDDYDAEYRYDRSPVGALQGLASDRVVYAGSASKILAPGLRLAWLVLPPQLLASGREIKRALDLGSPNLGQLAYADFLQTGELDRHLRRMRATYRSRRDALLAALARHCPAWQPEGIAAGLHLVARLPRGIDGRNSARHAAARSVRIYPMSEYTSDGSQPGSVVLGYGALTEDEIAEGISELAR